MISFLFALQFLTIIPVRIKKFDEIKFANSLMYFPAVGVLLTLALSAANNFFLCVGFSDFIVNIILVVVLIMLTGGMHLDGLSDTFDAIAGSKGKEKMLDIMRDSHCGVMGVLSIICVILLKISFLSSLLTAHKIGAIILMCLLGRWSMVFLIFVFPYARPEGKGKIFSERINSKIFIVATIFSAICAAIIFKIIGFLIMLLAALFAYLFGKFISKKIDGVTGDTLGAANELTEVTVLLIICFLERMGLSWIM